MPYADNNGVRIHYHVEGEGPPLVLQHGLISSLQRWYVSGYVEALKGDYRLLVLDARGHGDSGKPYDDEAYDRKIMASDVIAVLDAENIDKTHYLGYSMGGSTGFSIAEYFPERVHSIIIGGMHPYTLFTTLERMLGAVKDGMEVYVAGIEKNARVSPKRKEQLLSNDYKSITAAILGLKNRPDLSHVLPKMTMPCMVFAGDADSLHVGAEESAKHIPNVTWVSLPGLGHGQASDRSDIVLPHVNKFLNAVVQRVGTAS